MCTVLLRFAPGTRWPLLLGAVRDEFTERAWDPPARHWTGSRSALVGGRDRTAGGTWLAVDPSRPAMAAVLNGVRRPPLEHGARPTRGDLALRLLTAGDLPDDLTDFDRFHLLGADAERAELWSWDAGQLHHQVLEAGVHIIVNLGLDTDADPLVPHFTPQLAALPDPDDGLDAAWTAWIQLLQGDGLDPADDRALLVRKEVDGRTYGSTSASLLALSPEETRYAFTAIPSDPASWRLVER